MSLLAKVDQFVGNMRAQPRRFWLKLLIIPGVLLASLAISFLPSERYLLLAALGLFGALGVGLVLQWPGLGIIAILIGAVFVRYYGPGGLNAAVLGTGLMSGVLILDMLIKKKLFQFAEPKTSWPFIWFILACLLSFLVGQLPWIVYVDPTDLDAQAGGLAIYVLSCLAFLIMANLVDRILWLKIFTWLFFALSNLFVLGRFYDPLGAFFNRFYTSGSGGAVFWIWMIVIPFSQGLLNDKLPKAFRFFLLAMTSVILYASVIISSSWKSGYVPQLAALGVITVLYLRKRALWLLPLAVIGAGYVASTALSSEAYSYGTRLDAWLLVLQLGLISPIFGLGFGNYYRYTSTLSIRGWHVNFNSHSQYVDLFAQTGIVGTLLFFWIFYAVAKLGWQIRDKVPAGFERAYVYGALGGLAGMLVAGFFVDWLMPFVYNIGMDGFRASVLGWLFLGGLVSIKQIADKQGLLTENTVGGNND